MTGASIATMPSNKMAIRLSIAILFLRKRFHASLYRLAESALEIPASSYSLLRFHKPVMIFIFQCSFLM